MEILQKLKYQIVNIIQKLVQVQQVQIMVVQNVKMDFQEILYKII